MPPPSPVNLAKVQEQHDAAIANFLAMRSVDAVQVSAFLNGPYGGSSEVRSALVAQWAALLKPSAGGQAFWRVIREQWPSFDRIDHGEYRQQFKRFAPYWLLTREVANLKDGITVFRGQSRLSPVGLSWSLRREVAESYAHGHRGIPVPQPIVLERRIHRKQVALVIIDDRNEAEVVLWTPPRHQDRN
jgi:hypothetical protein